MKKLFALLLALVMVLSFASCGSKSGSDDADQTTGVKAYGSDVKVGVVLVGDETEGYTKAHMDGIKSAIKDLGVSEDNVIWKYKVEESSACSDAAEELALQGCNVIFSNSYGHQTYMVEVAAKYPDIQFVSVTGDFAAISGCDNFKNAFTNVYESRYVSGVVAGMKLAELVKDGTLTKDTQPDSFDKDGNIKIGYVGAYNYAEVVSGYTAFYLGVKSVVENVVMEVNYTNSWFDIEKEGASAEALIANGCVIIGQHADSTGAPAAVEKSLNDGKICYSIGYNVDMLKTAPNAALTSASNNWAVYYKYAIKQVMDGKQIDTDWAKGYTEDAVNITDLGSSCAKGTQEKVDEVIAAIKDGSLKVFDTSKFTADVDTNAAKFVTIKTDKDNHVTSCSVDLSYYDYSGKTPKVVYEGETKEAIEDGAFTESTLRSAPYFSIRIDGITED